MACAADISAGDAAALQACLDGSMPLPAPDFGYLRAHREAALQAAQDMVVTDHEVARGELLALKRSATALRLSAAARKAGRGFVGARARARPICSDIFFIPGVRNLEVGLE